MHDDEWITMEESENRDNSRRIVSSLLFPIGRTSNKSTYCVHNWDK